ncbi:hypothetical protein [Wielerella bovis]|uniref:hypothetical protein n=2 Tax=Wielerella bovis TaxID=2917790 RepID=UPI002019D0CB|nr:hypothetical protein [Wielerella bovis]MCG7656061.1 hypothetical protein [Wielerella bovis]MCG7658287.1 hypothetical protein [Wielerella bovis]ULJ62601.1 hypothetical protein MIS46_00410 [Wielerella bovis]ULJ64833.1 hypothetical protein MIS33_00455 [Wielerella bovis]ULJ67105.1 hypothetical protein MIS31_00455 [Wielerella bovis]
MLKKLVMSALLSLGLLACTNTQVMTPSQNQLSQSNPKMIGNWLCKTQDNAEMLLMLNKQNHLQGSSQFTMDNVVYKQYFAGNWKIIHQQLDLDMRMLDKVERIPAAQRDDFVIEGLKQNIGKQYQQQYTIMDMTDKQMRLKDNTDESANMICQKQV